MNKGYLLFALGIGAAIGGGVALLFAPQSGARTRKKLGKAFDEAAGSASQYAEDAGDYLKDQAASLSVDAQKALKQATEKATDLAGVAAEALQKSAAQAKAATSSIF